MTVKSLQVLFAGSETIDKSRITYGVAPGTMRNSSHLRFLIRADEGNILVDTGPHPDDVAARIAAGGQMDVKPEDYLPQSLKGVGLSMDDINMVVVTHLDWDHCAPELRDERRLLELLIHLFQALSLLWREKIVHRDLKPENILIRGD